ncbi:MAG TPA: hypothetical protein EYP10_09450 [Armatimonadetes bacterium]|nr:hypothetical protein [Armatimonadota bacterium]
MQIEFPNPFVANGNWFKGNLHTHTRNSDGDLEPLEMVQRYIDAGYDFLSLTDHSKLTIIEDFDNGDFLLIPGEEIGVGKSEVGTDFHLVAIGIERECKGASDVPSKYISPQAVIDNVRSQGGEVILCHPYWSQLSTQDLLSVNGYIGIEIFNTSCHYSVGKGFSTSHWDDLLARGRFVWGFAVDDAHFHFNDHRPNDACGAWVMVKCQELTVQQIMDALRAGMFYSSTGPQIHDVRIDGNVIHVVTSPVKAITFISENGRGERWTAISTESITEAQRTLSGNEKFVRIECVDAMGNCAWTNPMRILNNRSAEV